MVFSITGYVLEPPRVGGSNSPFTLTPNDFISNPAAFNGYYTSAEDVPRDDYLVLVLSDGKLPNALFGWTKNEGLIVGEAAVQRFDYQSKYQRFYPLPGGPVAVVGVLGSTSNTQRLKVAVPIGVTTAAPFRLSIGTIGSGTTQAISLVTSFGSPPPGTTELLTLGSNAGQLNWNAADLATFNGQTVRFQQQSPFPYASSNGNIGLIANGSLLLNPIPGDTQYPLIRIGYGLWLTAVEVPDEVHFTSPPAGTVQWALSTGMLHFNTSDVTNNSGTGVYYDGILIAANLSLPTQSLGTVNPSGVQAAVLSPIPAAGGDVIFRIPGVTDFSLQVATTTFDFSGKQGTVQYNPTTGQVLLSQADRTTYSGQPLVVTLGDLPIERGVSMRFFRTPVDLTGTDTAIKDVSAIYTVTGATWASPITAAPMVFLPSVPINSVGYPITVTVAEGTGSFTGPLPNLQVPSPPAGIGYVIDYDQGQLNYAFRNNLQLVPLTQSTPAAVLSPLIVNSQLSFAIETAPGSNVYAPFTETPPGSGTFTSTSGLGGILDRTAGQFAFTQIAGETTTSGSDGSFSGTTFTDPDQNFITDSVIAGDFLVVPAGLAEGVYVVETVGTTTLTTDVAGATASNIEYEIFASKEVLADRYFEQVELVDPNTTVFRGHLLTQGVDYTITPFFGIFNFTNRFLSLETATITYTTAADPTTVIVEPARFIVRKELTQPHPVPTSTLSFNPLGRTVAAQPAPVVFRGGRPQNTNGQIQCTVDITNSTITFLPDSQLTDALPHGAVVGPSENVYIDYYIYEALGGEQNVTVLNAPINVAQVNIVSDQNTLVVAGNYASDFPDDSILRIAKDQVYLIGTSVYDPVANATTVTLAGSEMFTDDYLNPALYVSSGPTPASYFITELAAYNPVAKGMNVVKLVGNLTSTYKSGTLLLFTDLGDTFEDYYEVTGASYDSGTNLTAATISRNVVQQYDTQILKHSVRPILESTTTTVSTLYPPVSTQPIIVWRKIQGQVGHILTSPTDYTIDSAGNVTLVTPLQPNEEVSVFYTGSFSVQAGLNFQASYTNVIAPDSTNGLLNQVLLADYSTFNPDNFYYRVETMTNFRGEYATDLQTQATASVPSGGPMTSNASQPQLYTEGKPSQYFDEGHYANQDIIARGVLVYYNSAVNYLEDLLHAMDGRVVGDSDGPFKFDGVIGRTIAGFPPTGVLNQIDDLIQVSPFPLPNGTFQQIYLNGPYSRFFTTSRNVFTTSPALAGHNDGDPLAQYTFQNLSSLSGITFKRWPRAQVQFDSPAGTQTFTVDNATGTTDALQRPSFVDNMRVIIVDAANTVYLADGAHFTVSSFTATSITLSSPVGVAVPAGATIYMAPSDADSRMVSGQGGYQMFYKFGTDVNCNLLTGELLYIPEPAIVFPLFGPTINPVQAGDILQSNGAGVNVTYLAPYRFPALDGGTTTDDGDQSVPLVGPTFDGEQVPSGGGPLNVEATAEAPGSAFQTTVTTPTLVATGNLNPARTVITLTSGTFPSPAPAPQDLVRITSGLNGATAWRHIQAVTTNSVTVAPLDAFAMVDSGFSFAVAVSSVSVTGIATLTGTDLNDTLASFLTSVQVGWTVVMTTGPNVGLRRQIAAIVSNTDLTLSSAFTSPTGGTYRIENPLDTYSGPQLVSLQNAVTSLSTALTREDTAILNFLTTVFTTVLTSTTGSVTGSTLNDASENFLTSGVSTSDFVYILTGPNAGVYPISSINSANQLTTGTPFPSVGTVPSYQIVSTFGVSLATVQALLNIYLQNVTFSASTSAFETAITTTVPVLLAGVVDPSEFAMGYLPSDLSSRYPLVTARFSANAGYITTVETPLTSSDKLYDVRYTWIDARIDQKDGLLVLQQRAVATRISNQASVVNQLTKLLAVEAT